MNSVAAVKCIPTPTVNKRIPASCDAIPLDPNEICDIPGLLKYPNTSEIKEAPQTMGAMPQQRVPAIAIEAIRA